MTDIAKRDIAMKDIAATDPCFLTIAEASKLIASRRLSPVELTRAYLARIERLDPLLNAFILVTADKAMADARKAEGEIMAGGWKGPLHGVPIGLKDIYNTAGIATTGHSALYRAHVPAEDAVTTRLLAQAGTILLGKLSTWEFAIGGTSFDLPWPPARNPWNRDHDPGGSSSGTGTAVAAGLVMAGMGTDTGGSIRFPAAWCGIAGLKPTYGRVSRRGILPLSFSLDHGGPMCWTSEDCALMMQVLSGHDPEDPASADVPVPDFVGALSLDLKGLRIGVPRHFWTTDSECGEETGKALEAALDVFRRLGAEVRDVALAPFQDYGDAAALISRTEAYAIHEQYLTKTPELYGEIARQRIALGSLVRGADYVNALRQRGALIRQLAQVMESVDLLVTPTTPGPAPKLGDIGNIMSRTRSLFTRVFNLTGSPALSTPSGFSKDGLPLSMQIVGRPFEDDLVLRAGHAYERATVWRNRRPADPQPVALAAE